MGRLCDLKTTTLRPHCYKSHLAVLQNLLCIHGPALPFSFDSGKEKCMLTFGNISVYRMRNKTVITARRQGEKSAVDTIKSGICAPACLLVYESGILIDWRNTKVCFNKHSYIWTRNAFMAEEKKDTVSWNKTYKLLIRERSPTLMW
jgi:hypothetical protein